MSLFSDQKEVGISTSTLLKIVLIAVALLFLWMVRDVLILLLISITLASALEPLVDALNEKKIPRAVSVLAVYILAIGLFVLVAYLIVPQVVNQFQQLASGGDLSRILATNSGSGLAHNLNLGTIVSRNVQALSDQVGNLSGQFFQKTLGVFNGFVEVITILVISFYLLAERNSMKHFVSTVTPKAYEKEVLYLVGKAQRKIGFWLLGQLVLSGIIFSLVLILLTIVGLKFALALAMLAGFCEIIPYLGPIISAIPTVLFAFLQGGPSLAVVVLLLFVLVQKTEGYFLVPKIMQRTTGLSPIVILVAILTGFKLDGIFGILLAVPIVSTINVVFQEWDNLKNIRNGEPVPANSKIDPLTAGEHAA